MKYLILLLSLAAGPAHAACYVDYKAKQDDPLRLHYGVIQLDRCDGDIVAAVAGRLAAADWTLLTVLTATEAYSPDQQEKAGEHFLRY